MGKKSRQKRSGKPNRPQPLNHSTFKPAGVIIPSLSGQPPFTANSGTPATKILNFGEQTQYIRGDIMRICILLVIVAILMAILVIIDRSGTILSRIGHSLSDIMRLQ